MRYAIGIDYGSKISGVARADLDSPVKIASPWKNVETDKLLNFLLEHKDGIEIIVLGKSLNLSGLHNKVNSQIELFANTLKEKGFKVDMIDERFTTQAALAEERLLHRKANTRSGMQKKRVDARAASLILQNFLDAHF